MIGSSAGCRGGCLNHIEPIHLATALRDAAPIGKGAGVGNKPRTGREEVGIKGNDNLRLAEVVVGSDRSTEG
jgi:hypothetical protein